MLLEYVSDCIDEINEVGEVWIEENAFGDLAEFVRNRVSIQLDENGVSHEIHEPKKGMYFVKIINSK